MPYFGYYIHTEEDMRTVLTVLSLSVHVVPYVSIYYGFCRDCPLIRRTVSYIYRTVSLILLQAQ